MKITSLTHGQKLSAGQIQRKSNFMDKEKLILWSENFIILYDTTHPFYQDTNRKEKVWTEPAEVWQGQVSLTHWVTTQVCCCGCDPCGNMLFSCDLECSADMGCRAAYVWRFMCESWVNPSDVGWVIFYLSNFLLNPMCMLILVSFWAGWGGQIRDQRGKE